MKLSDPYAAHFGKINKPRLLDEGIAQSLLSGWLAPLHSSFLWLLQEEEGVSFDTSKRWSAVGAGDPVLRYLESSPEDSSWTQQQQALCPNLFL